MTKKKILTGIVIAVIMFGVLAIMFTLFRGASTHRSELFFSEIKLQENDSRVVLVGELISSGKSYRGFSYRVENSTLIITIKSGLVNPVHPHGSFSIEIVDNQISGVRSIAIESGIEIESIFSSQS